MPRRLLTVNIFLLLNTYNKYTLNFLSGLAAEDRYMRPVPSIFASQAKGFCEKQTCSVYLHTN